MEAATRALELSGGGDPSVMDTLAVALASAGRFDDAVRTGRQALARAEALGSEPQALQLAQGIRERLRPCWRPGRPWWMLDWLPAIPDVRRLIGQGYGWNNFLPLCKENCSGARFFLYIP